MITTITFVVADSFYVYKYTNHFIFKLIIVSKCSFKEPNAALHLLNISRKAYLSCCKTPACLVHRMFWERDVHLPLHIFPQKPEEYSKCNPVRFHSCRLFQQLHSSGASHSESVLILYRGIRRRPVSLVKCHRNQRHHRNQPNQSRNILFSCSSNRCLCKPTSTAPPAAFSLRFTLQGIFCCCFYNMKSTDFRVNLSVPEKNVWEPCWGVLVSVWWKWRFFFQQMAVWDQTAPLLPLL